MAGNRGLDPETRPVKPAQRHAEDDGAAFARTSALSNYMVQTEHDQLRLCPAAGWLGALPSRLRREYLRGADAAQAGAAHPQERLVSMCKGDVHSCIVRVEGPQSVRHNIRIGERLPLDKGAPGA